MRNLVRILVCLSACFPSTASLLPYNVVTICWNGGMGGNCQYIALSNQTVNFSGTLGGSSTVSAFADGDATAMMSKDSASYSGLVGIGNYWTSLSSETVFEDTITISAPGLNGTVGYLEMQYSVDGTATTSGAATVAFDVQQPPFTGSFQSDSAFFSSTGGSVLLGPLTFQFGAPFLLGWGLGVGVALDSGLPSGSADFTAMVGGLAIFNSQGVNLTGSSVTVQTSGGETFAVLATPEPNGAILLFLGLITTPLRIASKRRSYIGSGMRAGL